MKKQILSKIAAIGISVLFQLPVFAEDSPSQEIWRQPYTPTRLQWLFMNLSGGKGENTPCGVYSRDNVPLAFYAWNIPNPDDNRLILSVITRRPDTNANVPAADRNFCMMSTFENLQLEASRVGASPPPVELRHFQIGSKGRILIGTYQCSVPVKGIDRFENLCR
jgi:hypothetical protein